MANRNLIPHARISQPEIANEARWRDEAHAYHLSLDAVRPQKRIETLRDSPGNDGFSNTSARACLLCGK